MPSYASDALKQFRLELQEDRPSPNNRSAVLDLLARSESFEFPEARRSLDLLASGKLDQPRVAVALKHPICVAAPWPTSIALVGIAALEQSSKRMALCWEAKRGDALVGNVELLLQQYPSGGVFVLPIFWLDAIGKWEIFPVPAFLPHLPREAFYLDRSVRREDWKLPEPMAIKFGNSILIAYPAVSIDSPGKASSTHPPFDWLSLAANLRDEILLAAHALPIIANGKPPNLSASPSNDFSAHAINHVEYFGLSSLRAIGLYENLNSTHPPTPEEWLEQLKCYSASRINLFTGLNGGGKSTVIDMILSLSDPTKLASLQRETTTNNVFSGFSIGIANSRQVAVTFRQQNGKKSGRHSDYRQTVTIFTFLNGKQTGNGHLEMPKFSAKPEDVADAHNLLENLGCNVQLFDGRHPPKVEAEDLAAELCKIGRYLLHTTGPSSSDDAGNDDILTAMQRAAPIFVTDSKHLNVWLRDDIGHPNRVTPDLLPSGWRAFGTLAAWLTTRPRGAICVIEEPETHLHPTFQRLLARRLGEVAEEKSLQLFIATHSATFINTQWWGTISPRIFGMKGGTLTDRPNIAALLRDLGMRQSDLQQANGLVWVEGPSDAVYLRYWIATYCEHAKLDVPTEDLEFSFAFYGGAVLSHFSVGDEPELIDMLRVNSNLVVIMDRDDDYQTMPDETLTPRYPERAKARIGKAVRELDPGTCWTWITSGYTIENYLPDEFRKRYFSETNPNRLEKTSNLSKVDIARNFVSEGPSFHKCFDHAKDLENKIKDLVATIERWNFL